MKTVLGLGDSILLQCNPIIEAHLSQAHMKYIYLNKDKKIEDLDRQDFINVGASTQLLKILNQAIEKKTKVDLLLIHVGLHDIKRTGSHQACLVPIEIFLKQLPEIFMRAKMIAPTIYWCIIPKIFDAHHNQHNIGFHRFNQDAICYNKKLRPIASKHDIQLIDTYQVMDHLGKASLMDHVHLNTNGKMTYASYIAKELIQGDIL